MNLLHCDIPPILVSEPNYTGDNLTVAPLSMDCGVNTWLLTSIEMSFSWQVTCMLPVASSLDSSVE